MSSGKDEQAESGISLQTARVVEILSRRPGAVELSVELAEGKGAERAICYPALCPHEAAVGDCVLLNTTAVELGLGSGGYHFVVANLSKTKRTAEYEGSYGHIIKLRYTPLQVCRLAVEEKDSPSHKALREARSLQGMPVVAAGLHSQIAPIAAAIKAHTSGRAKTAYIMNDTAALPLPFSRLVEELRRKRLIDVTITAGQAFGGDLEAVNIYSALLAAKQAAGADIAIVAQGPGNVGTDTLFGFGAVYQGEVVNAVGILEGVPVAAVRLSFSDSRPRHQGISQQFLVSLGRVALCRSTVVLPRLEEKKLLFLQEQLRDGGISALHEVIMEEGEAGLEELRRLGIEVTSMGRGIEDDREFFLAASAAGTAAAKKTAN
jgi:hypothetical protein